MTETLRSQFEPIAKRLFSGWHENSDEIQRELEAAYRAGEIAQLKEVANECFGLHHSTAIQEPDCDVMIRERLRALEPDTDSKNGLGTQREE